MKKVNTYSAQYKVIQPRKNNQNPLSSAQSSTPNPQSLVNSIPNKNISASGFKQFNL